MSSVELLILFLLVFVLWKILIPFAQLLFCYSIGRFFFSKRGDLRRAGDWAIVTGSTDGIGKAYAHELAKDGLNIVLISRNPEKLELVAGEIESTYRVKTKTIACDFTQPDIYEMLGRELGSLSSIACLVNNVGFSYPYLDAYIDAKFIDLQFIRSMINCNMNSVASLTKIVLQKMICQKSKNAAIINVSSFSGVLPFPYLSLYSASKAFVHHFSKALAYEVERNGILVQSVCPMLVATAMSGVKRTSFFVPSPQRCASDALSLLGVQQMTHGCIGHAIQAYLLSIYPKVFCKVAYYGYLKSMRRKKKLGY